MCRLLPAVPMVLACLAGAARADRGYWEELAQKPANVTPDGLYDERPDIAACREGDLKRIEPVKALKTLNAIRELHRLPPVTLDTLGQVLPAKASLMMVANNLMTHTPARSSKCGSGEGVSGSGESNLYFGSIAGTVPATETLVIGWLKDVDVAGLGHRRWLLDPFLGPVAYARVDDLKTNRFGAALRVFAPLDPPPDTSQLEFVAWPFERYPSLLWDPRAEWSLSLVDHARSRNDVRFSYFDHAAVTVRDAETKRTLDVSRLTRDTKGIGVPNVLTWRVADAQAGSWYDVSVENVTGPDGAGRSLAWKVFIDGAPPRKAVTAGGLTWERKNAQNGADTFTLAEAKRYCAGLGGRLPALAELQSVVARGRKFAVDLDTFPNISSQANYWTSTAWEHGQGYVDVIAFWDGGQVYQEQPGESAGVLCVLEHPR